MPVKPRAGNSAGKKPVRPRWLSCEFQLFASCAAFSIAVATCSMFFLSNVPVALAGVYGWLVPGWGCTGWLHKALKKSGEFEGLLEPQLDHQPGQDRLILTQPYLACFSGTMVLFSISMRSLPVLGIGAGMVLGWSCYAYNILGKA